MNNNLPIKQDKSFFGKIKAFFRKLFYQKNVEEVIEEQTPIISKQHEDKNQIKNTFQDSIKAETKNDYINDKKREDFLDDIEKNPSLLYELPVEKLEKLENYYKTSIQKYEEKLAKIKRAS